MAPLVRAMGVTLPFAAFNGGSLVGPDMKVIEARYLPAPAARQALAAMQRRGVAAFVFANDAWLVTELKAPNVDRERRTVDFDPTVVEGFDDVIDRIDKLVAVSLDAPALDGIEAELRASLAGPRQHRALAALLPRPHPSAGQQGRGGTAAGPAYRLRPGPHGGARRHDQ